MAIVSANVRLKNATHSHIGWTEGVEERVRAICEKGVLHPLESLPLEEPQQVTIMIADLSGSHEHELLASPEEWAEAANDSISLDEVRQELSTIRGSLSEIVEERRER